jgi:hypothetical protein
LSSSEQRQAVQRTLRHLPERPRLGLLLQVVVADVQAHEVQAQLAAHNAGRATAEERVQAGRIVSLSNPDAFTIGGGIPIVIDGRVVGAIGVSGATAAQDVAVAEVALAGD